jgi:Cu(I)/Ag(I) efflux system membrane protein CusA/SilA
MLLYLNQAYAGLEDQCREKGTLPTRQAIFDTVLQGACLRVRPVTMTATATIAGLLPIMLGTGTGSEVMRRIAAPMVGGMASAVLLTLLVLPVIFFLWKGIGSGSNTEPPV